MATAISEYEILKDDDRACVDAIAREWVLRGGNETGWLYLQDALRERVRHYEKEAGRC